MEVQQRTGDAKDQQDLKSFGYFVTFEKGPQAIEISLTDFSTLRRQASFEQQRFLYIISVLLEKIICINIIWCNDLCDYVYNAIKTLYLW